MDELTIIWTSTALKQRNNIFSYWNVRNNNLDYSKRLNLIIRKQTELLKDFPKMGKLTINKNIRKINL